MSHEQDAAIEQEASEAVQEKEGEDLRETIKQITLQALTERHLDRENIKSVVNSVLTGATQGVADSGERLKPALESSLKGVDDALSKSTVAAKLAAEEVLAKAEQFTKQDMKKVIDDLNTIEDLLFESVQLVASRSTELVSATLDELSGHLKNTGTSVGSEVVEAVKSLTTAVETAGKQGVAEVSKNSAELLVNVAKIGSGILSGMAEAIKSKNTPNS